MPSRREFMQQAAAAAIAATSTAVAHAAESTRPKITGKDSMLRLAIVGTGQISQNFLKQGVGNPRARFVATCARTIASAKARAAEYGIDAWFDDYTAMYEKVKPDAVIICTPSAVHAAPAIAAMHRGIHVLCEKPMATTFEDCQAMVAAASQSRVVFLNMPYDATPAVRTALQYLNEATVGVFTGAEAQLLVGGHSRANWYYDGAVAGGVMLDTLVYPVSRLVTLMGPARRVTGLVNTLIPNRIVGDQTVKSTIDDNVSLILEWPGGQQAILRALWGTSIVRNDSTLYGRQGTLWLKGNEVIVHSPKRVIPGAAPISWEGQTDCYRIPVKVGLSARAEALEHFIDCIRGTSEPTCGGAQQLHVHEILFKGYEAARAGRVQNLQTTFTPWHTIEPSFLDTRSRPI